MRDIPIIFSAPMVMALLREVEKPGTGKTMTRRLAWRPARKGEKIGEGSRIKAEGETPFVRKVVAHLRPSPWQKVEPGDRLWVRENFHATLDYNKPAVRVANLFGYTVTGDDREFVVPEIGRVREFASHLGGWGGRSSKNWPSIHMPLWMSRLTLVVTAKRIERLQEITGNDCASEGIVKRSIGTGPGRLRLYGVLPMEGDRLRYEATSPRDAFKNLWCGLNGSESWDANPEVVVVSLIVHKINVEQLARAA